MTIEVEALNKVRDEVVTLSRQVATLIERSESQGRTLGRLETAVRECRSEIKEVDDKLDEKVETLHGRVSSLRIIATRWASMFAGAVGLGTLIGWLLTLWDRMPRGPG
jgi:hypothetical protein